ncbi:MAG: hypothetical protein ABI184_06945 [Ginsengibacter sp.]
MKICIYLLKSNRLAQVGRPAPVGGKIFMNDRVLDSMRNSHGVNTLRNLYYTKGITRYQYNFGLSGLKDAGLNPIEQFIGSYSVFVSSNIEGGVLQFTITNTTSLRSADYHITPTSWNISPGYPMGTLSKQLFLLNL